MPRPLHIVFASGNLSANLYPGLAVAAHIAQRMPEARLTFIGAGKSLRHAVHAAGFRCANLPSQGAPRTALHAVRFVTDNLAGYWAARWFLREQRVSLVMGLGGYAGAATVRAAISRGIPTVLVEQNAVPGRVTRWLAPSATVVCAGFAEAQAYLPSHVRLLVTGNAARPEFERMYRQEGSGLRVHGSDDCQSESAEQTPQPRRMVVIGGAGGARSLNESMPATLQRLGNALDGWQVIHQSGEGQLQETVHRYRDAGVDALVVAFVDEMASLLFHSDLVVCRAAGTTLAELALAGAPAVLVPHPQATDAYQLANAEIFAAAGAATIVDETALSAPLDEVLADELRPLLTNDATRSALSANMRRLAAPDAATHITEAICEILCGKTQRLAA